LEAKLKDSEENQGEMEVLDVLFDTTKLYARIGDKQAAYDACDVIIAKPKVLILIFIFPSLFLRGGKDDVFKCFSRDLFLYVLYVFVFDRYHRVKRLTLPCAS
jgi:hypothetical protein